jgi:predicted dehydrogenase
VDGIVTANFIAGIFNRSRCLGSVVKEQKRPQDRYNNPILSLLLNHGIHAVDLLRFFGGDIVAVTVRANQLPQATTALALIEYASGATGTLTLVASIQMDWFEGLHVHGEKGSIIARIPFPYMKKPSEVQIFDTHTNEYRTPTSPDSDQYERQAEAFADAILKGRPVSPSGEDGLAAEKVLYAMYESQNHAGQRVAIT